MHCRCRILKDISFLFGNVSALALSEVQANRAWPVCDKARPIWHAQSSPIHWLSEMMTRVVRSKIFGIEIAIFWSLRIGRGKICIFCTFFHHFWPIEPLIEPKFEMMINTNGQNNHQCLFMWPQNIQGKAAANDMGPYLAIFTIWFEDQDRDRDLYLLAQLCLAAA